MHVRFFRYAAAGVPGILALLASLDAAAGQMTICNRSDARMDYAMVWDEGIPRFADIWKISGWHRLEQNSCVTMGRSGWLQNLFLSVRYETPDGLRIANYGVDKECVLCDTHLGGIELFFCVKEDRFERTESIIDDLWECPSGYYLQLFNIFSKSGPRTNFTLELK